LGPPITRSGCKPTTVPRADLYDPREGDPAVRVHDLRLESGLHEPARTNYFAVYRIDSGLGDVAADVVRCPFGPGSVTFSAPYQYVCVDIEQSVLGELIEFHANFLCVGTFHAELGCSEALFNDPYGEPVLPLAGPALADNSQQGTVGRG
jgi:hypothetical protein